MEHLETRLVPAVTLTPGALSAPLSGTTFGTSVAVSGPDLLEGAAGDIGTGTIILHAPTGFVFDTSSVVVVHLQAGFSDGNKNINHAGVGSNLALTSETSTDLTFTISAASTKNANELLWENIKVAAVDGAARTGNITNTGNSVFTVVGGATNYGTLTEVASTTTTVSDAGGVYTGSPFAASALATGAGGLNDTNSADFTFDYVNTDTSADLHAVAPTNVGHYSVTATYNGDATHGSSTSSPKTFSITVASSTTTASDSGGAYTGSAFAASALATGAGGLHDTTAADFTFDYVNTDTSPHVDMGSTAPSDVGHYSVRATYNGDANHSGSTSSP